jgi:hypothetical protein
VKREAERTARTPPEIPYRQPLRGANLSATNRCVQARIQAIIELQLPYPDIGTPT